MIVVVCSSGKGLVSSSVDATTVKCPLDSRGISPTSSKLTCLLWKTSVYSCQVILAIVTARNSLILCITRDKHSTELDV